MKNRLLIIGVDGMDPEVVSSLRGKLPAVEALRETTGDVRYESIFPPDSMPAWISFFTGKTPAEHGVLQAIDYLSPTVPGVADLSRFQGQTFWDAASRGGKRVLVVNPFLAYPPWPVNGVMASGPVYIKGEPKTAPPDYAEKFPLPFMGGYVHAPGEKELPAFLSQAEQETRDLAEYTIKLWRELQPDLCFVTFLTLDRMQHFCWRYADPQDPTYPGSTALGNAIEHFYRLYDEIIAELREAAGPDTETLVMSDHGHGRRCVHFLNLNEILRREGLLSCHGGTSPVSTQRLLEKAKNLATRTAHRWRLERWLRRAARWVPNRQALKRGDHIVDKKGSLAYTSDFGGWNPSGGIHVNREAVPSDEYEPLRNRLIDLLMHIHRHGAFDPPPVRWAKRREEIYEGPRLEVYPDVLFELHPDYGVNWSVFDPLVVPNPRHRALSGGHRKPGILLVSSPDMGRDVSGAQYPNTLYPHILRWLKVNPSS